MELAGAPGWSRKKFHALDEGDAKIGLTYLAGRIW